MKDDFSPELNDPSKYPKVTSPEEAANSIAGGIGRLLPPIGLTTAGEALGGLAGGGIGGPPGAIIGGLIGGGLGNVAARNLPEAIGGNPNQSNLNAFLWGAVPGGVLTGLGELHALRAGKKLVGATETMTKEAEDALSGLTDEMRGHVARVLNPGPRTANDVNGVLNQLGISRPGPYIAPADAEARRISNFQLRDAITGPIQRLRDKWSAGLASAYDSLKGSNQVLTEKEAGKLADAANDVQDNLLSPAPRSQALLARIQKFQPSGEGIDLPSEAELKSYPPAKQEYFRKLYAGEVQKNNNDMPTLDELRQLRQDVNIRLRTATGGDRFALGQLQHALDDALTPHLPKEWSQMRANYKSFSDQFPYQKLNQLARTPDEIETAKWLWGDPSRQSFIREIINNANDQEKEQLRQGFDKFLLNQIDFNQPSSGQFEKMQKALQPYMQNNTLRDLFGPTDIAKRMYLPMHAKALTDQLKTDAGEAAFNQGFELEFRSNQNPDTNRAVENGFRALVQSLPADDQRALMQLYPKSPQVNPAKIQSQLPVFSNDPNAAANRLLLDRLKASQKMAFSNQQQQTRGMMYVLAGALTGHFFGTPFAASKIMMAQGGKLQQALLTLATQTGMGKPFIEMMTKHPGDVGKLMYQLMAGIGAAVGSKMANPPRDPNEIQVPQ